MCVCVFVYVHKWQTFSRLVESFSSFITMMTQKNNNGSSMVANAFFRSSPFHYDLVCALRCGMVRICSRFDVCMMMISV